MASRAALSAFLLAACTSPSLYFDPEVLSAELRCNEVDLAARLVVAWGGVGEQDGLPVLHFLVRVENPGPESFTLAPAEFELRNWAQTPLGLARLDDVLAIAPGRSETFDLAFPVPAGKGQRLDLQDLTLQVRLDGRRWEWSAEFEHDYKSGDPSWG